MALTKSLPFGHAADGWHVTYWRLLPERVQMASDGVHYALGGYSSEAARRAGAPPRFEVEGTMPLAWAGLVQPWEATPAHLYGHAARAAGATICTQAMVDAGHYAADLLGKPVMADSSPPALTGADDA